MESLRKRMAELGIREEDLQEQFLRGTGKGGQKRNKTSACVRLIHRPSGIEVKCERERSQWRNRQVAREMLCDQVEEQRLAKKRSARSQAEKRRRQRRGRPAGVKRKMISNRYHNSRKKQLRRKPSAND